MGGENVNRECALRLAAAGLAVFPCDPKTRKPLVEWRSASTTDATAVEQWWTRWPGAVPALDLARCGLLTLDGDRHHPGIDGVAALRTLLQQQPGLQLRLLPMVATPRDGIHVYFRQSYPALGNSNAGLPAGIDVRGAGGFVLAPGAMLGDRRRYQPVAGQPELADCLRCQGIPEAPPGIVMLLKAKATRSQARRIPSGRRARASAPTPRLRYAAPPPNSPQSPRATATTRSTRPPSGSGSMVARGWLSEDEVEDALSRAMATNGYTEDKGAKAIEATLASGLAAGLGSPHDDLPNRASRLTISCAYLPAHYYIYTPCREPWPAASVNARIPPIVVGVDADGEASKSAPAPGSTVHQPVEQMTWAPGEPHLIRDRLVVHGGWIERPA